MNFLEKMNSNDNLLTCSKTGRQFTNEHSIPQEICEIIMHYSSLYDGKPSARYAISVTDLLKPIRQLLLSFEHPYNDKEIIDISSLRASAFGTLIHEGLEIALTKKPGYTLEQRADLKVGKWNISGKFDIVKNGMIKDLKTTGNYTLKKIEEEKELMQNGLSIEQQLVNTPTYSKYQLQLSIYKAMNPELITEPYGKIIFHLTNGGGFGNYELDSELSIPLYRTEEIADFIKRKTDLMDKYIDDETLPLCTDAERWAKSAEYKLTRMNKSGKFSTVRGSKFNNENDFRNFIKLNGRAGDQEVVKKAEYSYCEKYCPMKSFCTQYQNS